MSGPSRLLATLGCVALAVLGTGCQDNRPSDAPAVPTTDVFPAPSAAPEPGRFATVGPLVTMSYGENEALLTALIQGPLQQREGCVTVGALAVVWPAGVSWDADTDTVISAAGEHFSVGQDFTGGGGVVDLQALEELGASDAVLTALRDCASEPGGAVGSGGIALVNTLGPPGADRADPG